MIRDRSFHFFYLVLSFLVATNFGCVAPTVVPEPSSETIKTIKSLEVHGYNRSVLKTGVHVAKGDLYTLIAEGRVLNLVNRGYEKRDVPPETLLEVIINGKIQIAPPINATLPSPIDGEISLIVKDTFRSYNPQKHIYNEAKLLLKNKNIGSYKVTIIVWNTKDIDQILAFLNQIDSKNPNSAVSEKLIAQAHSLKASLAEAKIVSATTAEKTTEILYTSTVSSPPPESESTDIQALEIAASAPASQPEEKSLTLTEKPQTHEALKDQYSPVMVLLSPREGQTTTMATIQLVGVVEDDTALLKVEITVNGMPLVQKMERGIALETAQLEARFEFNEIIPIVVGPNHIKIRAEDTSGRISEKVVSIRRVESEGTVWAVVVGVNDYPNLPRLKYAVNDAQAFHDFLIDSELVSPDNVFRVVNDQATLDSMRTILGTNLKKRARKGDKVIIYFAGHGATERDVNSPDGDGLEKYLLPFNADPDNLYATAMPMREIAHILNRIQSDSLIFIADSCYSGASGGRTVSLGGIRSSLSDNYIDRIAGGKGRVILTASAANEVSMEDEDLEHGIFTYYLIKGLKGLADYDGDGYVTVDEVYRYVSEEVPEATGQTQHPIKKGSVEGQLVLGVVK